MTRTPSSTNLGESINKFAGNELVDIHENKLPPSTNPNPADARHDVDSGIAVDADNNRNPFRGETFSNDFVGGAVATDLSRIALGFAKSEGKSWPQSHVDLKGVPNRMFGTDNKADPQAARAAKADISPASIRNEFQKKPHTQREAQQQTDVSYNKETKEFSKEGGWKPADNDTRHLGWQNKNTLSPAVSTPLPGDHGYAGIDPQHAPFTPPGPSNPAPAPDAPAKGKKGKGKEKPPPPPVDSTTKHQKMANVLNMALSDNNSNVTRTFGTLQHGILPIADNPRPDGMFQAVHDALGTDPANKAPKDFRAGTIGNAAMASPEITTQIADFRQEHGLENGHVVNAFIEPGPTPVTPSRTAGAGTAPT